MDTVLWWTVIGGLDQMLCCCVSSLMICQWSRTDLENCLPSSEYGVTTGRAVLELDALRDSVEKSITRVEESFGDAASDDF